MTRYTPKGRRLVFSILIAIAVSLLPLAIGFFTFLWLPGTLVGRILFGTRILVSSFSPLRAALSAIIWSLVLYFGTALWKWGEPGTTIEAPAAGRYVFIFWLVLLIPWLLLFALSGMAFDGGYTAEAYAFAWSVWTYPITVGIAAVFRKWAPWTVVLPLLNIVGCGASTLLHK